MNSSLACRPYVIVLAALAVSQAVNAAPATSLAAQTLRAVKGGTAKIRAPGPDAATKALLDLVKQENAIALAARTPRPPAGKAPTPTAIHSALRQSSMISTLEGDGIHTVNNKGTGFVVSPGIQLTIKGHGFGDTMGQANVIGEMPGGAAALRIIDWRDDEVDTLLPPGLRGAPDQTVFVQAITHAGKTYKLGGGRYIADREEVVITTNIELFLKLDFRGSPEFDAALDNAGIVERSREDNSAPEDCWGAGGDRLKTLNHKGFVPVGLDAQWGRTDSGDRDGDGHPGHRTFTPGYSFGRWEAYPPGDLIFVRWGMWHSHTNSPPAGTHPDQCLSFYQLTVTLLGPAGVSPF